MGIRRTLDVMSVSCVAATYRKQMHHTTVNFKHVCRVYSMHCLSM